MMSDDMAEKGKDAGDARIQDEIAQRLRTELSAEAEQVQVNVLGGEATLAGTVESMETRARAEECAKQVGGVSFVVNNLRVAQEGTTGTTG
jgi:osmotically-inducible protein OsmY